MGMTSIRKVCQLIEGCDGHGECKVVWGGVTVVRKYNMQSSRRYVS